MDVYSTHAGSQVKLLPVQQTAKTYKCTKCGYQQKITTNHYGNCWSFGRVNTCPKCPPYAKYPEFGGQTVWECVSANATIGGYSAKAV
jgi:NAD-dependent SIR2 family protein deacetylase